MITCGLAETQRINTYNMKELIEIQNELETKRKLTKINELEEELKKLKDSLIIKN